MQGDSPRGVMGKILDTGLEVSKFKLESCYVYFQANNLGKGMNPFIPSAMG